MSVFSYKTCLNYSRNYSRSEAVRGFGLGLYVARKHVEAHHGQIWAESPGRGAGSTFFVRLPIHKRRAG
ncbi:hypothetical protein D4R87_00300 [bacterium]|nr:MAG: hypothetical protein D4R87_00300 [bacterium]